jgi:hypothetical protein
MYYRILFNSGRLGCIIIDRDTVIRVADIFSKSKTDYPVGILKFIPNEVIK